MTGLLELKRLTDMSAWCELLLVQAAVMCLILGVGGLSHTLCACLVSVPLGCMLWGTGMRGPQE